MSLQIIYNAVESNQKYLLLILLPVLVYAGSLWGGFVYDDVTITVVNNPALTGEAGLGEVLLWDRPLREFTYMLDHAVWGLNPFGYHLQNVVWHAANTVLLFHLLMLIGFSSIASVAAALLFAVHPVNAESVAWISGRKELLCLFFELLSCCLLVRYIQNKRTAEYVLAMVALLLALLSKQVAVMTPLLMGLCVWLSHGRSSQPPVKFYAKVLAVPAVVVLLSLVFYFDIARVAEVVQERGTFYDPASTGVDYTLLSAALTPFATFLESVRLLVCPIDLTVEREFSPVTHWLDARWMTGFVLLACIVFIALQTRKNAPQILFGLLWFLFAWLPVCGAVPVGYVMAERYLYIPAIGLFILVVYLTSAGWERSSSNSPPDSLHIAIFVLILFLLCGRTVARTFDWRDETSLWQSAVQANPLSAKGYSNLGMAYKDAGERGKAYQAWEKALELRPGYPQVWVNLGNMLMDEGEDDKAETCYRNALESEKDYGSAYYNLALLYEKKGETGLALEHFQLAAKHLYGKRDTDQRKAMAYYQCARLYFQTGDPQQAEIFLKQALSLSRNNPSAYVLLGMLKQQQPTEARAAFEQALEIDPDNADALFNLGVLEWFEGNKLLAKEYWNSAVQHNPSLQERIDAIAQ